MNKLRNKLITYRRSHRRRESCSSSLNWIVAVRNCGECCAKVTLCRRVLNENVNAIFFVRVPIFRFRDRRFRGPDVAVSPALLHNRSSALVRVGSEKRWPAARAGATVLAFGNSTTLIGGFNIVPVLAISSVRSCGAELRCYVLCICSVLFR